MVKKSKPNHQLVPKKRLSVLVLTSLFVLVLTGAVVYSLGTLNINEHSPTKPHVAAMIHLPPLEEIEITEPVTEEPTALLWLFEPEIIYNPVVRPMTTARQDNSYGPEIGRIMIESVNMDLAMIQGAGSNQQSVFQRLFYAVADKVDAELGADNFILASHSVSGNVNAGFSPLLVYQDGSFNPYRNLDVDQLVLQIGDLITIFLEETQRYYTFEISLIEGDGVPGFPRLLELLADIEGRPQLTLYSCSAVGGNPDGRIVVQADLISILFTEVEK